MALYKHAQRWLVALTVALSALVMPLMSLPARAASALTIDAGAESPDMALQLAYYFQRDVTIKQGTTISWNFPSGEPHSVNFAGGTGGGGPVDSGLRTKGAAPFSVTFPAVGNYQYHCDLHPTMTGVVHVISSAQPDPPGQLYYNTLTAVQKGQLFNEGRLLMAQNQYPAARQVTVGVGAVHPTGAIYIMRFLQRVTTVKVGDTVTFTNRDSEAPHTITLNLDFPNPGDAVMPVGLDTALPVLPGHATARAITNHINSGFLWNVPVLPAPLNRGPVFKMTFTAPGTYNYHCELHDVLGMTGQIVVTQ